MDLNLPKTFVKGFHNEEKVKKMPYEEFANTDMKISKLSLGAGAFGGSLTYGDYDHQKATDTLVNALQSGMNFIDGGGHYGKGLAETFLGSALKKVPRNAYYISTKVGRCGNQFDFTADAIKRDFEHSLKRLQLENVDIIFIHDVEFAPSQDLILNETLPTLETFVKAGKARFIGVTGYSLSAIWDIVKKSTVEIKCILSYCRDTLLDNSLQDFIPKFQAINIAVINAGCVGMGLLSNSGPPTWHPASQQIKNMCNSAASYCIKNDVELGKLAVYHSIKQPGTCTCVVGINGSEILKLNLDVLWYGLSEKEDRVLRYLKENYFQENMRNHWEGVELESYRKGSF